MQRRGILLLLGLFAAANLTAQTAPPALDDIAAAYANFEYERLDSLIQKALADYGQYTPEELFKIHLYGGSAHYARGDLDAAREHFAAMLSIKPNPEIDAVDFSPKIIEFIEQIRRQTANSERTASAQQPRYILLPDKRPGAAWRSLILPGWGQRYKGEKQKSVVLTSAAVLAISGLTVSAFKTAQTHDAYLQATDPIDIEDRFQTYSAWSKTRTAFIWSAGIVWGYAFFDALLTASPPLSLSYDPSRSLFALAYHF